MCVCVGVGVGVGVWCRGRAVTGHMRAAMTVPRVVVLLMERWQAAH